MTRHLALGLGLVTGCLAGFFVHCARVVPVVPMEVTYPSGYTAVTTEWSAPPAHQHDDSAGPSYAGEKWPLPNVRTMVSERDRWPDGDGWRRRHSTWDSIGEIENHLAFAEAPAHQ